MTNTDFDRVLGARTESEAAQESRDKLIKLLSQRNFTSRVKLSDWLIHEAFVLKIGAQNNSRRAHK